MHVHLYMFESETTSKTCFLYAPPKFTGLETSQLDCGEAFYLTFTFLCIRIKLKGRKESMEEGRNRKRKQGKKRGGMNWEIRVDMCTLQRRLPWQLRQ